MKTSAIRKTDPQFYKEVIQSDLAPKLKEAYSVIFRLGPVTGREADTYQSTTDCHTYFHDLERGGLVNKIRKRKCKITGATSWEWGVTGTSKITAPPVLEDHDIPTAMMLQRFADEVVHIYQVAKNAGHGRHSPNFKAVYTWIRNGAHCKKCSPQKKKERQ